MKSFAFIACAAALKVRVSPMEKVLELLSDLQAKVIKDGEETERLFEEFTDWCKSESKDTQFEIQTSTSDGERFAASVSQSSASIAAEKTKIEELTASIATNEKDLKTATELRATEAANFAEADAELAETIDMLGRAVGIIEKEMKKSSFVQTAPLEKVADALQSLVNAPSLRAFDKARVQALIEMQNGQPSGAPEAAAYESHSSGILETLENMLDQSQGQRSEAQKAEMNAKFNFELLEQKLKDEIAVQNKELKESKQAKAAAEEANAEANGNVQRSGSELAESQKKLKELHRECMNKATAHEEEQHERSQELDALAKAKNILEKKSGGAADRAYSFVQVKTKTGSEGHVVALVQKLAKEQHSAELAQLAMRIRTAVTFGADPFAKVKGMLQSMMEKLLAEAKEEADHKAFCDKEMSETKAKRDDKQDEVDTTQTRMDKAAAKIAKLTEGIAAVESELAAMAAGQKEATAMRSEEKAAWTAAKNDFTSGLSGVQTALNVLRDYYASKDEEALVQTTAPSTDSSVGIISMLEVIESDFSKLLAEGTAAEEQAQNDYDKITQEFQVSNAAKKTEVTYMKKDLKETEAGLQDLKSDQAVSTSELDAIIEYEDKLKPQCIAKPEPYEERKKRREQEINGLKEALTILENETAGGADAFLAVRS